MKYKYLGVDTSTNQRIEGEVDAVSQQEAVRQLSEQRVEVFSLTPAENESSKGKRVTVSDLVLPLQELAALTGSGVSLIDSVRALAQKKEHPKLAKGFSEIASKVEGGGNFSDAIAESKLPFPEYVSHLVSAGELSGQLSLALQNASEQLNYDESIKNDLRSALTYPAVLIGSGFAAMLIIFFAVVPKFSHLLDGEKELPTLAWLVLSAGKHANESPFTILAGVGIIVAVLAAVLMNKTVRQNMLDFGLNIPVIGPWLSEQDAARWSSLSAAMLLAKVDLIAALKLASSSCPYTARKKRAESMISDIESGASFADALQRARLVPETSLNLVAVGDKTGKLAEMLKAVANLHDAACKRRMKQVLTLMEPIAILVVGVIIGILIMGIVLAITASTDIAI